MAEERKNNHHCRLQNTLLRKCGCGKYHLHYKYVMLTFPRQVLFKIMKECYEWDALRSASPIVFQDKSLKLMIGVVELTIAPEDFEDFNEAIQEGTTDALNIGELLGNAS